MSIDAPMVANGHSLCMSMLPDLGLMIISRRKHRSFRGLRSGAYAVCVSPVSRARIATSPRRTAFARRRRRGRSAPSRGRGGRPWRRPGRRRLGGRAIPPACAGRTAPSTSTCSSSRSARTGSLWRRRRRTAPLRHRVRVAVLEPDVRPDRDPLLPMLYMGPPAPLAVQDFRRSPFCSNPLDETHQGGAGVIEPLPQHLTREAVHEEQVVLPSIDIRKGERLPRRSTTDPGGRLHTRSNIHTSTDHHGRGSLRRDRNEHDQQNQGQKSSRVKPKPAQLTRPDSTQN